MFRFFKALKAVLWDRNNLELSKWFHVTSDEEGVYRRVDPPGGEGYEDSFLWSDIIRVCFMANDPLEGDEVVFFTSQREESYVVPMDADGGHALWLAVLDRQLFDDDLAVEAALSTGGIYCWPKASV